MTLREALAICDARKVAALGDDAEPADGNIHLRYAESVEQDQAIFSGYDIDHAELMSVIDEMTEFFYAVSAQFGIVTTLKAAIADALQIGLVKGADSREH
jgi:hypothetical protein